MNKKFSTLVAVLLAAGAWTTLDAKVVKITEPVVGGQYLIGTTVTAGEGAEGKVAGLFQTTNLYAPVAEAPISDETNEWTLEEVSGTPGQFYLKNGNDYLSVSGSGDKNTAKDTDVSKAIKFVWDGTAQKLKVAVAPGNTSTIAKDDFLKLNAGAAASTEANDGTVLKFGSYSEDAYIGLPGLGNVKTTNGVVDPTSLESNETVDAPLYITDADNKYLSVKYDAKAKKYVLATGDDALTTTVPTAAQSLSASWRWVNGKLVSVAAERDGKVAELTFDNTANPKYGVSGTGTTLTAKADGLYLNTDKAISTVSVSATSVAASTTPSGLSTGSIIVDASNLKLQTSVPDDYCLVTLKDGATTKYLYADPSTGAVRAETNFTPANYKGYLWKVSRSAAGSGAYNYSFTSLAEKDNKAIVWEQNGTTTFVATTGSLNGLTLTSKGNNVKNDAAATDATSTRAIVAFYNAPTAAKQESELNKIYDLGFEMTVKISKDGTETIEGIDVFGQKMYAISNGNDEASSANNATSTSVQLWNNEDKTARGAKVLVLDVTEEVGNNDDSAVNGKFKWITAKELTDNAANYKSFFQFRYSAGKPNTTGVEQLAVMDGYSGGLYSVAYILRVQDKYYLTSLVAGSISSTSKLPYINLEASNIYDVKKLLGQYLSFSYADTKANTPEAEQYKLGAMLAVTLNETTVEADFITGTSAVLPEAQWAVTAADKDNNTFELTNRENADKKLTGVQLRVVGNKFVITANGGAGNANITSDLVTLTATALSKTTNFDGYMQSTPNALRNENYYLGQYHAVEGNNHAYFVENHTDKASHQIGMTAEKENAQKWNLHLATKADEDNKYTLVDTVKVPLVFATLIDNKIVTDATNKDVVKDTLFILPYAFQNASNREFVSYKDVKGSNYYICNENYKENSDVNEAEVIKFALKMKPDNTYNFVELTMDTDGNDDAFGDDKVLGGNSANKGVISRVATYDQNANSLMVVEKADAPEYHKIEMAWGDTIKLFREENNSQVVYEKRDDKSVVMKDTLSFLNIDNINQFKLNPAIFADTAYINRTFANGELNTCYQYLLAVNVDPEKSYYCPYNPEHNTDEWRAEHNGPCADAKEHRAVYGRFLINLIDTANVYGAEHIHNNPYIDELEVGADKRAKLSFVEGIHANDTLFITRQGGEVVKLGMDTPDFNVAKFAFRYVDAAAKTFKIQTQFKEYAPGRDEDDLHVSNDGYLRWINGALVVTEDFENGDVFGIEENFAGDPTANEDVTVSSISVEAINGAVIIKGAEGKTVSIVNVLGQTIANTVISSSEATIAAPAGVVVVAVEGEAAVKAIVK